MDDSTPTKRHYCTVCPNYRGKNVNGNIVTLHRFPTNARVKSAWIRRIKLVKKGFKHNIYQRLCSEHFVAGQFEKNVVPSVFGQRRFKTTTMESSTPSPTVSDQEYPRLEIHVHVPEHHGEAVNLKSGLSSEQTSVIFHDYLGAVNIEEISNSLNKHCQTNIAKSCAAISTQTLNTAQRHASTQTDGDETYNVRKLCDCSRKPVEVRTFVNVGTQCNKPSVTIEDIRSDEKCMFYTGIPNQKVVYALFEEMGDASEKTQRAVSNSNSGTGRPRSLRLIDEFFMVLMRLRLGLLLGDLADRFFISKSTCGVICEKWLDYLHLKLSFLTVWPSRELVNKHMPKKFSKKYPNCRVIIDCTEFYTETPQSLSNKSLMYSSYKSHMTYKALLGISPAGIISFVSDLWSGNISDKQITKQCGILELCEKGDAIMADKIFNFRLNYTLRCRHDYSALQDSPIF